MVSVLRRVASLGLGGFLLIAGAAADATTLWQAIQNGKPDLYMRYRFEQVDDAQLPVVKDAYANTLRTALGYSTGLFHDFGAYLQLEDVRVLGSEDFNDGGGNGITSRAVVVDPAGTEIQQANFRYRGLPRTTVTVGRQEIEHRLAPLHRYVGNILWRQNWQSFDALRVVNDSLPATHIDYAYLWNVNRIFGEDNPIIDRSNYGSDSHALSVTYGGFSWGKLEGYSYLLDFESVNRGTQVLATATNGARFQGQRDVIAYSSKILYTAEYARQIDYADNPADIGVNYYLLELGGLKLFNSPAFEAVTLKASYEVLEGDGPLQIGAARVARAFQTPLGTNHAFQGWADRFLTTPADGIVDVYGTLIVKSYGAQFMLFYHDFSSDRDDYDYGHEWNAQVTRTFYDHYTVGFKYARYEADQNRLNLARNGAASAGKQAFDLDKVWAWIEFRF
jgi:hypothetical protein